MWALWNECTHTCGRSPVASSTYGLAGAALSALRPASATPSLQLLSVGLALASRSSLVLLDEPAAGLGTAAVQRMAHALGRAAEVGPVGQEGRESYYMT